MNELKQNITTAIKGLTRRNQIKLEHLQVIETAVSNPKFDDNFWLNTFKSNANLALQEGIYTTEMVRLLTLRAIILPATLPEFLIWMLQRKGKDQGHYQLYLDFQEQLLTLIKKMINQAPYLSQKIDQGVLIIIIILIDKPEIFQGVLWLLQDKKGIWAKFYQERIRQYIDYDLTLMAKCSRQQNYEQLSLSNEQNWLKLWQEIGSYWQPNANLNINPKYKYLAQLFEGLQDYRISAFFYYISLGKVPENVFGKLTKYGFCSVLSTQVYNLTVYRYVNLIEAIILPIINLCITLKFDILFNFIKNKIIEFYYYCKPNITIIFWKVTQFFQDYPLIKSFLISLLYLLMWFIIYVIFALITAELDAEIIMIIPIIMNVPLAIIFIFFGSLINHWMAFIFAYLFYFLYRFMWFKDKSNLTFKEKLGLRIREFFVWVIVTAILASVISVLYNLVSF